MVLLRRRRPEPEPEPPPEWARFFGAEEWQAFLAELRRSLDAIGIG